MIISFVDMDIFDIFQLYLCRFCQAFSAIIIGFAEKNRFTIDLNKKIFFKINPITNENKNTTLPKNS